MTTALRHSLPSATAPIRDEPGHDPPWLSRTLDTLLEHVRALLPVDGVAFLGVDRQRRWIEPVAGWFASEELRAAIEPARRRYHGGRPGLPELALERDRPLLLPRVEAWEAAPGLRAAAVEALGEERAASAWEAYRSASVIACRVRTTLGRTLGVLIVASLDEDRPLGGKELQAVEVLADMAALGLERAELLDAEARRAREELQLKRAAEGMAESLEPSDVYRAIVEHAAALTGASKVLLTRLDLRARELAVVGTEGLSADFARRRLPLDHGMLGEVARTRTPYVSSESDSGRWDRSVVGPEGIRSFMHAPIELGPRLFGVISVAHEEPGRFDAADLELLVKLARSSAAAIANAIDFQRERQVARALTLGFVPESLPELPGHEVGLLYAPAANQATGGDVYGAWPLAGGELAVLVGDVAGKGVATAALSAMVRFFIEARSWDSSCPAAVLGQANAMLLERLPRESFATAFFGILTPSGLRWACAGHHPPLLLRAGAEPEELPGGGLPLGISARPDYAEAALELRPDDLLFAYTDGLVEARRGGELYGVERLAAFLAERHRELPPDRLVRAVHEEVADFAGGLADDAVALALRRRPA